MGFEETLYIYSTSVHFSTSTVKYSAVLYSVPVDYFYGIFPHSSHDGWYKIMHRSNDKQTTIVPHKKRKSNFHVVSEKEKR